jgi:hypothetical protein
MLFASTLTVVEAKQTLASSVLFWNEHFWNDVITSDFDCIEQTLQNHLFLLLTFNPAFYGLKFSAV